MTITQLEYILALDQYRHFVTAAEHCFVTQPTLSMQVQKLEDELGIKIFDRSKQPLLPTPMGVKIIERARALVQEFNDLKNFIQYEKSELVGEVRLGVIPTLAPYLLPLFLSDFMIKNSGLKIVIEELQTEQIIQKLHENGLDLGLVVTPLNDDKLIEYPVFNEAFVLYLSDNHPMLQEEEITPAQLKSKQFWVLNEGHCFRNQVMQICGSQPDQQLSYESGSLETLRKMVDNGLGMTMLPELAIFDLGDEQLKRVRRFVNPQPVREVSLVSNHMFYKHSLLRTLSQSILENIPRFIKEGRKENVVYWRN